MSATFPLPQQLPADADAATAVVRALRAAGHRALLAGGCVRDLLLGRTPHDYDVATDAVPDRVVELFRSTRKVGVQFGVVLVRKRGQWVEVATFRADGDYQDGRRPTHVTFSDPQSDALRRDFTVNGMFLDPLDAVVIDYVDGRADLDARLIRAIGDPRRRFAEDYLRILRAVRFAARLDFALEPETRSAIGEFADKLPLVARERVLDELSRMLGHASRARALRLMRETGLLTRLWPHAEFAAETLDAATAALARLPDDAPFELAFALLTADRNPAQIDAVCRDLTCSNESRETVRWLALHQADLDAPAAPSLAQLKRLMAHSAFRWLQCWALTRYATRPDADKLAATLRDRVDAVAPANVAPPPLVTGDDLTALGVPTGPIYKQVLDEVYEMQLNETLSTAAEALDAAKDCLRRAGRHV